MCYTLCILSPIVPWVPFCACTSISKLMAPVINLLWVDEYSASSAQYKAISYPDSVTLMDLVISQITESEDLSTHCSDFESHTLF